MPTSPSWHIVLCEKWELCTYLLNPIYKITSSFRAWVIKLKIKSLQSNFLNSKKRLGSKPETYLTIALATYVCVSHPT